MVSSHGADEAALERSYSVAPPVEVAIAEGLLREAKQIMDQLGVVFFLRQGTCLGAIRDQGIIPWDDDLDIGSIIGLHGVTEKTVDTVASAFSEQGYFARIERNDHYTNVSMMKSSTRIDWTCYRIVDHSIVHYPGVRIPARLFTRLKEIDFIGAKFLVPNPPEEYLRHKYGAAWRTPKKTGFEQDVLNLVADGPRDVSSNNTSGNGGGKLRVLDHESNPIFDAEVRVAGVGRSRTNKLGYTKLNLPSDDWYALVIKYDNHEEVLYQEKLTRDQTYIYRADPAAVSGRLCVLSTA
ncbi:LicD family protein [Candidatus Spongiihabitans sp.]|uniref:LicD family protein n=1 Tax=Candidatus Spongiihabitans sp. TaxID=3101308 RepID=UPI003C79CE78